MPRDAQERIVNKIESLRSNPRPHGSIKLRGHEEYRVRVGEYRVIYAVADERLVVLIVEIGNRRDIYRIR
jgi:mRNA interferase RelE/StbE